MDNPKTSALTSSGFDLVSVLHGSHYSFALDATSVVVRPNTTSLRRFPFARFKAKPTSLTCLPLLEVDQTLGGG